jgi:hypothetical protein
VYLNELALFGEAAPLLAETLFDVLQVADVREIAFLSGRN